jgi:hypothetical protein
MFVAQRFEAIVRRAAAVAHELDGFVRGAPHVHERFRDDHRFRPSVQCTSTRWPEPIREAMNALISGTFGSMTSSSPSGKLT